MRRAVKGPGTVDQRSTTNEFGVGGTVDTHAARKFGVGSTVDTHAAQEFGVGGTVDTQALTWTMTKK